MVKISKSSRRRVVEENYSIKNKLLNRHFVNLFVLAFVFLAISLYFFVLSVEEIEERVTHMAQAYSAPRILSSGKPFLMYGTAWKEENTATLVHKAVKAGFRFIDTACQPKHYNEEGVGQGWTAAAQEVGLDRSDLFLQTKFTSLSGQDPKRVPYDGSAPLEEQVQHSLKVSLHNLKTDYIDSLVLHSPLQRFDDTMKVWRQFEEFVDGGKVLRLGISNCYDYEMFTHLYEEARIKPTILQNRFYSDSNFDTELRKFCKEKNIWYQSFWTLTANRRALAEPAVEEWAESKKLTPQTLLYAFLMSLGYPKPLDGTTNEKHMAEDVALMKRMQDGEQIFETEEELRKFAGILGMPDL